MMHSSSAILVGKERSVAAMRPNAAHSRHRPLRVLHVVSRMRRAGIETWLMHVLRSVDSEHVQMDFLVHSTKPADFDAEIRSRGSQLLYAGPFRQLWSYGRRVRELLERQPPYDVVHSHIDCLSGYVLKSAAEAGVPIRIAHSHNDQNRSFSQLRWSLKLLSHHGKSLVAKYRTHGLAASKLAGNSLFGESAASRRWNVLPCGIDLEPDERTTAPADVRREFGISEDALVIGHVGRFEEQKNHRLIVRIAESLRRRTEKCHFVLVGAGLLLRSIEQEVRTRGLEKVVTFAGVRADVPRLFGSLFDVFLFPSHFEGLGLVLVESQAAGCPAVISQVIPAEADVVPNLVTRLPLAASPEIWAEAILAVAKRPRTTEMRAKAYRTVVESPFNIERCVADLTSFYQSAALSRAVA